MNTNTKISETDAQDALFILSEHLIDPLWREKYKFLTKGQQNTIIINKIYKKFPNGFKTIPWIIKNTLKEIIKNW